MRNFKTILATAGAAAVIVSLAGCGVNLHASHAPAPAQHSQATTPGTTKTETVPPAPATGTSTNPAPWGSELTTQPGQVNSFKATYANVVWNANDAVASGNMFNDSAPAGMQWMEVDLGLTNTGTNAFSPGTVAYNVAFVSDAGVSYPQKMATIPNGLFSDSNQLYPGTSVVHTLTFLVPAGTASGMIVFNGYFERLG